MYHKKQSDDVYMAPEICSVTDRILSFWTIFCPFTLPLTTKKIKIQKKKKNKNKKKKKKKKVKKILGDIIILHMCTIHEDHTMYGS